MNSIRAPELVFPLVGCKSRAVGDVLPIDQVCGTAFYIKNGNFIVAGHSLRKALQHEHLGLGRVHNDRWQHVDIPDHEIVSDYDIGFVKAEIADAKALNWDFSEQHVLVDIQTIGFPFALDWETLALRMRAFKGYIVSRLTYHKLAGNPRCYELSFNCPRGLSGAPLFTQRQARVAGVVIANRSTEMLVYTDKEIVSEDVEVVTERYEAMQLGIAIQTTSLQHIESALLGGSLLEYLESVGLA